MDGNFPVYVGLGVNFLAILALVYRISAWGGKVDTLLERHESEHGLHREAVTQLQQDVAGLKGGRGGRY